MSHLHPILRYMTRAHDPLPSPPSFPTRRSSDLSRKSFRRNPKKSLRLRIVLKRKTFLEVIAVCPPVKPWVFKDRKSTRLNSSHVSISYAVFCLKKQNTEAVTHGVPSC